MTYYYIPMTTPTTFMTMKIRCSKILEKYENREIGAIPDKGTRLMGWTRCLASFPLQSSRIIAIYADTRSYDKNLMTCMT